MNKAFPQGPSSIIAAEMQRTQGELARGNVLGALEIVTALVEAGAADKRVFGVYRHLYSLAHGRDIPHAQVFNRIYANDEWEGGSGPGSFPEATATYRAFLQDFMKKNSVRSVVDVGCGDWQSSRLIDWTGVDYTGIDVSSVVLKNTRSFGRSGIRFIEGDARTMDLPQADLLIVKDVLQHWSNADIMAIIPKLRRFRYCLITNGATAHQKGDINKDGPAGGFRPVDLSLPPFGVQGSYVLNYDVAYTSRQEGNVRAVVRTFLVDREKSAQRAARGTQEVPSIFAHEYDLNALHLIKPRGHEFSMYVTPRYRDHYEANPYERFSASLVSTILRGADLFIDIGASYGFYSMLAAARHPDLDVIAVEPTPATTAILKKNVALLGPSKVSVRQLAVSDAIGHHKFNVTFASDSCGFFDHPNVGSLETIDVETTTVDALLADRAPCRAIIKIDTEGNELAVLRGMEKTLERFPDLRLVIEFCPGTLRSAGVEPRALLEEIERLGFDAFLLDERRRKFYRARPDNDNLKWTRSDYANLYCVRRAQALSVCFFAHSSALAGSERVLLELVDDLIVDHGAVCSVVLPSVGPLAAALAELGAAPIIAPYSWWAAGPENPQQSIVQTLGSSAQSIVRAAAPDIRLLDPDVIWSQTMVIPWGAMTAAMLGKPHVWYVTEFGARDHGLEFISPIRQTAREILQSSDFVYTASKVVAQELFPGASANQVQTLYCNVRIPDAGREPQVPQEPFYRVPGAVKLGIFTNINPSKGQEDIVRAVVELAKRGQNVELLLAGYEKPAYRQLLDQIVKQNGLAGRVHFAGHLTNQYQAMRQADVVVMCSRNEAFGRTGVEAMLLGKPVVYPNVAGPLEYSIDGETGLSYAPGDLAGLVGCLKQLIADPARRETMGQRGRAHAEALFTKGGFSGSVYETLLKLRSKAKPVARMPATLAQNIFADVAAASPDYGTVGRNDPCPCGSGKKYKHCHGALA